MHVRFMILSSNLGNLMKVKTNYKQKLIFLKSEIENFKKMSCGS